MLASQHLPGLRSTGSRSLHHLTYPNGLSHSMHQGTPARGNTSNLRSARLIKGAYTQSSLGRSPSWQNRIATLVEGNKGAASRNVMRNRSFSTSGPSRFKSCIVTGGSSGIGLSIAKAFTAHGVHVHIVGRSKNKLEAARDQIILSVPEEIEAPIVETHSGSVADSKFWEELENKTTGVDILVNAAGVTHYSFFSRINPAVIDQVVDTNLKGVMLGCKFIARGMIRSASKKRKDGPTDACIINIASLLGLLGGRGTAAYAASKAGVLGLTRALAAEYGPAGVRVNAIVPGYTDTNMIKDISEARREQLVSAIPLKRFANPDEIADAAVFLANNKYANNCIINLDGGLSAIGV